MRYLRPLGIILLLSFLGEVCHALLPVPIPASIYGMALLLLALGCKLLKTEDVKPAGSFLVGLLPLLFVVPTVGLMACWDLIRENIIAMGIVIVVSTVLTFGVSGLLAKFMQKGEKAND